MTDQALKARIHIGLKSGVLDPQGKAVADTLGRMGFAEVSGARIGKVIELDLAGTHPDEARARVTDMCEQLLANTVIETYSIELLGA